MWISLAWTRCLGAGRSQQGAGLCRLKERFKDVRGWPNPKTSDVPAGFRCATGFCWFSASFICLIPFVLCKRGGGGFWLFRSWPKGEFGPELHLVNERRLN